MKDDIVRKKVICTMQPNVCGFQGAFIYGGRGDNVSGVVGVNVWVVMRQVFTRR